MLALAGLTAILATTLGAMSAHAGSGLVTVVTSGASGKGFDLKVFALAAQAAAEQAGWTLATQPLEAREARAASACLDRDRPLSCLASILSSRGADRLLVLAVGASADDAATLQMTASVVVADRVGPVVAERFCKACDEPALRTVVHELVRSLIESAAVGAGRTLVTVTATPAGAWISWDGSLVPSSVVGQASYARIATSAGAHTLTVESPGFASQILPVIARDGTPTAVKVQLRRTEATPDPRRAPPPPGSAGWDDRWRTPVGWGLLGAGAAIAATGVGLVLKDEDQPPLGSDRSAQYFDSAGFGTGLLIGGAVAAGIGGTLLLTGPRGPARSAGGPTRAAVPSLPILQVGPRGLVAAWGTAF
jgi:hypothetical protein